MALPQLICTTRCPTSNVSALFSRFRDNGAARVSSRPETPVKFQCTSASLSLILPCPPGIRPDAGLLKQRKTLPPDRPVQVYDRYIEKVLHPRSWPQPQDAALPVANHHGYLVNVTLKRSRSPPECPRHCQGRHMRAATRCGCRNSRSRSVLAE